MYLLRAATPGATAASASFSSNAILTRNLAIRAGAEASTINRCNGAGGKMRHAPRFPQSISLTDLPLLVARSVMVRTLAAIYRGMGIYLVKILKGEKPADLPVEQPTKFDPLIISRLQRALVLPCRRPC